jgi:hypothetical protein
VCRTNINGRSASTDQAAANNRLHAELTMPSYINIIPLGRGTTMDGVSVSTRYLAPRPGAVSSSADPQSAESASSTRRSAPFAYFNARPPSFSHSRSPVTRPASSGAHDLGSYIDEFMLETAARETRAQSTASGSGGSATNQPRTAQASFDTSQSPSSLPVPWAHLYRMGGNELLTRRSMSSSTGAEEVQAPSTSASGRHYHLRSSTTATASPSYRPYPLGRPSLLASTASSTIATATKSTDPAKTEVKTDAKDEGQTSSSSSIPDLPATPRSSLLLTDDDDDDTSVDAG